MDQIYDVLVIGGGINGCGCAADAALRGLTVILCEKGDIGSQTSSSSTKLIHGGLRYLEQFNFKLVHKALNERQRLLDLAPHLVHPLAICLPLKHKIRPNWMIRSGLYLYDHLSRQNKLPHSKRLKRQAQPNYFTALAPDINNGFLFYDCATDDARLTLANALQAKIHGASISPNTIVKGARFIDNLWHVNIQTSNGDESLIQARSIINATGPWVTKVNQLLGIHSQFEITLVKGSHIVLPKLYEGNHAYMLQHHDKRIIFAIPYHNFTMIGTTDVPYSSDIEQMHIDHNELQYLLEIVQTYFTKSYSAKDVINSWSGVRPLVADPKKSASELNRDYFVNYQQNPGPIVTIYGGKITTYRQLAKKAVNQLQALFPNLHPCSTQHTPLPGAQFDRMNFIEYQFHAREEFHWLDKTLLNRLLHAYGTRTQLILNGCINEQDLGIHFGYGLYQREVDYLIKEEWAQTTSDILWRRTKLGLIFDSVATEQVGEYLDSKTVQVF